MLDEIYTTSQTSAVSAHSNFLYATSAFETMSFTALDQTLQKLQPAQMDASTRMECLEGTSRNLIQFIIAWAAIFPDLFPGRRVVWLHGFSGSGKGTLATTVANFFREQGSLGAFIFFN